MISILIEILNKIMLKGNSIKFYSSSNQPRNNNEDGDIVILKNNRRIKSGFSI